MCKFCEPTTPIVDDESYNPELYPGEPPERTFMGCYPISENSYGRTPLREDDRKIWIDGDTLFAETSGREYGEWSAKIKFCPMCGRDLTQKGT